MTQAVNVRHHTNVGGVRIAQTLPHNGQYQSNCNLGNSQPIWQQYTTATSFLVNIYLVKRVTRNARFRDLTFPWSMDLTPTFSSSMTIGVWVTEAHIGNCAWRNELGDHRRTRSLVSRTPWGQGVDCCHTRRLLVSTYSWDMVRHSISQLTVKHFTHQTTWRHLKWDCHRGTIAIRK